MIPGMQRRNIRPKRDKMLMTGGLARTAMALTAMALSIQCAVAKDVSGVDRDIADVLSAVIKHTRSFPNDMIYIDCSYETKWGIGTIYKNDLRRYMRIRVSKDIEPKNDKPPSYYLLLAGVPKEEICGPDGSHASKPEIRRLLRDLSFQNRSSSRHIIHNVLVSFGVPVFNRRRSRAILGYSSVAHCYTLKRDGQLYFGLDTVATSSIVLEKSTKWKVIEWIQNGIGDGACWEGPT